MTVFSRDIMVRFGHCDAAGIVYTGEIPNYILNVIEDWWREVAGLSWFEQTTKAGYASPFVHLSLDFRAPLAPDHPVRIDLSILRLGRTSIRFGAKGFQAERLCFEGEFVETFIDGKRFKAMPPPPEVLARIREKTPPLVDESEG